MSEPRRIELSRIAAQLLTDRLAAYDAATRRAWREVEAALGLVLGERGEVLVPGERAELQRDPDGALVAILVHAAPAAGGDE